MLTLCLENPTPCSVKLNSINFFFIKFCFRLKRFPPKSRLLSSDEFHAQSVLETTKALEELKTFCNSPESKPWRMMTRLKDPQRFVFGSVRFPFPQSLFDVV